MENPSMQVWRHDGVINFIMPVSSLITMGITLGAAHSAWACHVCTEWLSLLTDDVIENDPSIETDRERTIIKNVRDSSLKTHRTSGVNRTKIGDADFLEGYAYGTIHPVELHAVGVSVKAQLAGMEGFPPSAVSATLQIFAAADARFVRPSEMMALSSKEIRV